MSKVIAVIENVTKIVKTDADGNEVEYYFGSLPSSIAYDVRFSSEIEIFMRTKSIILEIPFF